MSTGSSRLAAESSAAPPAGRRARAVAAWVAMPLVALLLGVALDATDLVAPDPLGGTAARYLPVEGQRTIALGVDEVETVSEHARSVGLETVLAAPPAVAAELVDGLGDEGVLRAQWWRVTRVGDDGRRSTALHRVSAEGIALAATWGGELGLVLDPPLLVLPAEVSPGDEWRASGSALAQGAIVYEAELSAWQPVERYADTQGRDLPLTGGCLGVDAELRLTEPGGDFARTLTESTLWCPGRGPVWSSAELDGAAVGFAEVRPPSLSPLPGDEPVPTWAEAVASASGWASGGLVERTVDDPFFGRAPATGQNAVTPAATPAGELVTANDRGDDVEVWRFDDGAARLAWAGHPGGTIVAVGVVGDLVVATTAQRRVVAYDAVGRRLWSRGLDELVLGAPVAVGAGAEPDAVVATRGGEVVRLRAGTGEIVWSRSIGADARGGPVAAGDVVLVADERERLTALDATTGATRWRADVGLVDALAAAADAGTAPGAAAAIVDGRALVVLDLADGAERRSARLGGLARGLVVTDSLVIGLTDERLLALDAGAPRGDEADAGERWSGAGGDALTGGGAAVAVVRDGRLALVSTLDGGELDEVAVDAPGTGAARAAIVVGGSLVLADSDGALRRWSLR